MARLREILALADAIVVIGCTATFQPLPLGRARIVPLGITQLAQGGALGHDLGPLLDDAGSARDRRGKRKDWKRSKQEAACLGDALYANCRYCNLIDEQTT